MSRFSPFDIASVGWCPLGDFLKVRTKSENKTRYYLARLTLANLAAPVRLK